MKEKRFHWMNKLGSAPLLLMALLFAFGIYLFYITCEFPSASKFFAPIVPTFAIVAILCIFIIAIIFLLGIKKTSLPLVAMVFILIGFFSAQIVMEDKYEGEYIKPHDYLLGRIVDVKSNGANSISLILDEIVLEGESQQSIKGKTELIIYGESYDFLIKRFNIQSYYIKAKSKLMFPSGAIDRGFYNESLALISEGVSYKALAHYATVDVVDTGTVSYFDSFINSLQRSFSKNINKYIGGQEAGLLKAVLTGDKSGLDSVIKDNFSMLGTSHLLATSGLHIGVMLLVVVFILKKLHTPIIFRTIICALVIFIFLMFAGFRTSMIRASIMWLTLMVSRIFGKRSYVLNSLGAAMLGMLMFNPFTLFSVSFILSCVSVAAIGVFADTFKALEWTGVLKKMLDGVLVSLAVVLFSWPVIGYYFNNIPLLSPLFNLFFVPLVSLALIAGIIFGILSGIGFLAPVLGVVIKAIYSFIISASQFASNYSPQLNIISPPIIVAVIWMTGTMLLMFSIKKGWKLKRKLIPISMLVMSIAIMVVVQFQASRLSETKIYSDGSKSFIYITQDDENIIVLNDSSFIVGSVLEKAVKDDLSVLIYSGNDAEGLIETLDYLSDVDIGEIYVSAGLYEELSNFERDINILNTADILGYRFEMLDFKAKSKTAKIHYAVVILQYDTDVIYLDPMSVREGAFDGREFDGIISSKWSMKRAEGVSNIKIDNLYYVSLNACMDEYILQLEQEGAKTYNITGKAKKLFINGD